MNSSREKENCIKKKIQFNINLIQIKNYLKMAMEINNDLKKNKVINYVLNFGKKLDQELINWIDADFNFDNVYKT